MRKAARYRPGVIAAACAAALCLIPTTASAAGGGAAATLFAAIAVLLVAARGMALLERFGLPAVLGELLLGIAAGNLALVGIGVLEPVKADEAFRFLAELGVVILLFQIGLESSVQSMMKVGVRAFLVAIVGVVVPFVLGTYLVGPVLFPGLSFNTYLFFGATLTATSVGITARVFQDMGVLRSPEAQIVLGAAVIDDVIGLVILAVVSAIVKTGSIGVAEMSIIIAKATGFLVGAIIIGQLAAPWFTRVFAKIQTGTGMKLTIAIGTCLMFAAVAGWIGLAPIVGAFAAGLILDEVVFKYFADPTIHHDIRGAIKDSDEGTRKRVNEVLRAHSKHHLEELVQPIAQVFVPLFFVYTGMQVNLGVLADPKIVLLALGVTALAFAGKLVSGWHHSHTLPCMSYRPQAFGDF